MNIAVIGAAGRTGAEVVELAVAERHHVTALVRDPEKYQPPDASVVVHRADVLQAPSLCGLFAGADAVLVTVGPSNGKEPTRVYSQGLASVTAEMRRAGVTRLVIISAVPASLPEEKNLFERYLLHPILWRFFGPSYADLRVMEKTLRSITDLQWTVVRPPLLTDDQPTGAYRTAVDSRLKGARKISRADLAAAMLAAADDDSLIGHVVTISV